MDREQIQVFAQSLSEPCCVIQSDGIIVVANSAACKIFQIDIREIEGVSLYSLVADSSEKLTRYLGNWARSRTSLPGSITIKQSNGEQIKFHCKGSMLESNSDNEPATIILHGKIKGESHIGFLALNQKVEELQKEVVERRKIEEALRISQEQVLAMNQDLERRIEERTSELRIANRELKSSLDTLRQTQRQLVQSEKMAALGGLVAGVAHEINTPLGIGVTASSHLEGKIKDYDRLRQSGQLSRHEFESLLNIAKETSRMISLNLKRAADLIRSFKQVAVDQTSGNKREFNLKNYLMEIRNSLKPNFAKSKHQMHIDCPEGINLYSYPGAISQIMTNLVMNSLIHGFYGIDEGLISVNITLEGQSVHMVYSDNGNGIAEENLPNIFDPFFTTKRGQGGSGLGLHITFNLVTQTLGGAIECESKLNEGTIFNLSFPLTCQDKDNNASLHEQDSDMVTIPS